MSLLSQRYSELFPAGYSSRHLKLANHNILLQRFRNTWSYNTTSPYVPMILCLIKHTATLPLFLPYFQGISKLKARYWHYGSLWVLTLLWRYSSILSQPPARDGGQCYPRFSAAVYHRKETPLPI
jgi:hypothetical protein